ncbi:UPF0715 family protein [Alkalihalobacillus trypoxylicola]|uniref:UPF0715 family protein n=1 Tax=Alkalihalobacillus trypoxylicola TaxID=519424 RepID=UPI0009EDA6F6
MIGLIFLCLLGSSLLASTYYFIFLTPGFSFLALIYICSFYFIAFSVIALPTQIILRIKPKRFSIKYLFIYIIIAYIGSFIFSILFITSLSSITTSDLLVLLKMGIYNAIVFWLLDSIILDEDYIL